MKLSEYLLQLERLLEKRGDQHILMTTRIVLEDWTEFPEPSDSIKKIDPCRKFRG